MSGRRRGGERILVGSLGALIQEYRKSAEFAQLRPATKTAYLRALGHMESLYRVALPDIKRRHVKRLRDRFMDRPAIANQLAAVFSTLMAYAVEQEYIEANPAARVKKFKLGRHKRWTDGQINFALATLGERYRRATLFGLHTGQRLGDCLMAPWTAYDGHGVSFIQQKTGAAVWVECGPELKAELAGWRAEALAGKIAPTTILSDARGLPFKIASFSANYSRELRTHPELNGCTFHGLRATMASRIAEAGGTHREIAAVTGHKTIGLVQHYTQDVDQRSLATAAILKLQRK